MHCPRPTDRETRRLTYGIPLPIFEILRAFGPYRGGKEAFEMLSTPKACTLSKSMSPILDPQLPVTWLGPQDPFQRFVLRDPGFSVKTGSRLPMQGMLRSS